MNKPVKQKRCASCRDLFTPKRIGLKLTKVCLNAGCVLDWAQMCKQKEIRRQNRQRKAEFLDNDKSHQKKKARKAFNEFIRLRDRADGCISCDKSSSWNGQWHAGHYKTVGARPDLRFNEDNCHKQCSVCNNYLSGNLAEYRARLMGKIGMKRLEALDQTSIAIPMTAQDYSLVYKKYSALCKELKQSA